MQKICCKHKSQYILCVARFYSVIARLALEKKQRYTYMANAPPSANRRVQSRRSSRSEKISLWFAVQRSGWLGKYCDRNRSTMAIASLSTS